MMPRFFLLAFFNLILLFSSSLFFVTEANEPVEGFQETNIQTGIDSDENSMNVTETLETTEQQIKEEPPAGNNWVQVFLNGGNNTGDEPSAYIDITPFQLSGDFFSFLLEIQRRIPTLLEYCYIPSGEYFCHPDGLRLYNWQRNRVRTTEDLRPRDLLFVVMWNESFIWPGLYVGHKVTINAPIIYPNGTSTTRQVVLETVTLSPRAFVMEEFLTDDECQTIRDLGERELKSSTVGLEATLATLQRNSRTSWLTPDIDPRIAQLCNRASFVTHTPNTHQEALQLLHYPGGGFYNSHCDYFGEPTCSKHPSERNRFITLLFYLNDVEGGGATSFSRVSAPNDTDDPWQRDPANTDCNYGYVSRPKKRKALMFYNLHPPHYRKAPLGDHVSEHIACNVTSGEKWAANFWIWNNRRVGDDAKRLYQHVHDGQWWDLGELKDDGLVSTSDGVMMELSEADNTNNSNDDYGDVEIINEDLEIEYVD